MTEAVILINSFEVRAGGAEEFIAAWEKTRDYLATQPGYIDTGGAQLSVWGSWHTCLARR